MFKAREVINDMAKKYDVNKLPVYLKKSYGECKIKRVK